MPSRRFKLPVLSRLTLAWIAFGAFGVVAACFMIFDNGRTRALVAMAVEGIELFAPPEQRPASAKPASLERLAAGEAALGAEPGSDMLDQPPVADAPDALASISDVTAPYEDPGADIFITVDGAPARAIGVERTKRVVAIAPVASPDEGLLRRSAYGQVPRIGADGRRAAKVYAQTFSPGKEPPVALIVGGLGINKSLTERAIDELPAHVTLAFAPYAKDLIFWTKRARDAGHEVMIEIPMENRDIDATALGPAALTTSRPEANEQRLDWILSRFQGYFGATNYLGAKFSGDRAAMDALLQRLREAGVAYVDDTGVMARNAAQKDVTTVDRLVDPGYGDGGSQTKRDLESLEKIAKSGGDALGKTYVHDTSLGEIADWAHSLEEKGLTLAPASAVLALRAGDR
jgi:hypothetical protein